MNAFLAAFWAETLKARRSKISLLTTLGFLILPLAGGLFMIILKNPEQARAMGLISAKAQLTVGVADWQAFFGMLSQGIATGGTIVFALITSWVFGREFSDHTAKELLALPTPRWIIVAAKFGLIALWILGLALLIFVVGLGVGTAVDIPGWSLALEWSSFGNVLLTTFLNLMLLPFVAWFASMGRGYLPPLSWTILAMVFANIFSVLGWGDWFPWAVPVLTSMMYGARAQDIGIHSYTMVALTFMLGLILTFNWWRSADQAR